MIQLVRPTEELKEQAFEFKQEFFDHGEFVINGSELFDKTDDYTEWCRSIDANTKEETVNPALPTGEIRYIRSDVPENLSDKEIRWLLENHIITIVDLRSDEEAAEKPCILKKQKGFRYFHLPVTGGGDTPKSLEHLHTIYQQMVDEQMELF